MAKIVRHRDGLEVVDPEQDHYRRVRYPEGHWINLVWRNPSVEPVLDDDGVTWHGRWREVHT